MRLGVLWSVLIELAELISPRIKFDSEKEEIDNLITLNFLLLQEDLQDYLIHVPLLTPDDQLCLLAGKILLYYAETEEVCF